jgi:hypothetical protein
MINAKLHLYTVKISGVRLNGTFDINYDDDEREIGDPTQHAFQEC